MKVSLRHRLSALCFLFLLFCSSSIPAGASTLFERSLQKLEANLRNSGAAREFTFVVMGDSRDNDEVFAKILIQAASYNPLFILHSGDAVGRGTEKEYDHFLETLHNTVPIMPFFVVVGNHELMKRGESLFKEKIAPLDYVLDLAGLGIKIVALNNAGKSLSSAQLHYLDKELSPGRALNFVIMHIPPKTPRWDADHSFSRGAGELEQILTTRKVAMAFFGHLHLSDEDVIGGVQYIITGGAGAPLHHAGFGDASYHFIVVKVENGAASAEAVRLRQ